MEYTIQERVIITACVISASLRVSVEDCRRRFCVEFLKETPSRQIHADWKNKLLETGSLLHQRFGQGRLRSARDQENEERVLTSVNANILQHLRIVSLRISYIPDISVSNSEEKSVSCIISLLATVLPRTG